MAKEAAMSAAAEKLEKEGDALVRAKDYDGAKSKYLHAEGIYKNAGDPRASTAGNKARHVATPGAIKVLEKDIKEGRAHQTFGPLSTWAKAKKSGAV